MTIYLPALVCLIGLFIYLTASKPKVDSIGKDMFWCGLLVTLWEMAGKVLHVP